MAVAPWLPPKTRMVNFSATLPSSIFLMISLLTGLPLSIVRPPGKNRLDSSKEI